jgi:Pvc16 N-terminal domain
MSNILEQDGTLAPNISNKLLVFLVNVEKETTSSRQGNSASFERSASTYPPVFMNLYVMVAGNFSGANYSEGLKFLSNTVSFFQRQPVFDHQQTPDLDKRITKLALDIENLNFQDLSGLWGMLSGKYQPSILYKVRMVSFDAGDIKSQLSPVKGYQASLG